ncbi:MAG: family hydrolase [Gemmatimonadetes bacterium]|jgi:beta-phosphoglucomutase-like phosphatase (HAD superfamily)|nr:family hydrolase [Gemmatimonadota bacterium]
MVNAVLVEWEGVLADTRLARRSALLASLAEEGVASDAVADEEACRGMSVHAAATTALRVAGRVDATLVDLVALRAERSFLAGLANGCVLSPGAAAFVQHAQHRSRVMIVTRASRAETDLFLRLSGLDGAITAVLCADDILGDAPAVSLYTQALEHLTRLRPIAASRAVAVVDALPAIRAARGAGVPALAVGAPAHEALEADGAVDSLDRLTMDDLARLVVPAHPERPA